MTDEAPVPELKRPRNRKVEVVEDAVVVDGTTPVTVAEPVEPAKPAEPAQQVVYIQTPPAPRKAGNRGIGSLLAVASAIIFAAVFAIVVGVIVAIQTGTVSFSFIAQPTFYVPVLFYVIGLVLLVLILNRAGWAAYVIGSLLVGVLVYFGTVGVFILGKGVVLMTPTEASVLFNAALRDPLVIAAALVGREVSLWIGALISRRGRRLKVRNAEAHASYERELADKKADHERAAGTAAPAS